MTILRNSKIKKWNSSKETESIKTNDNIEIIIENCQNLFENEHKIIKDGAYVILENGYVKNYEEAIIIFATMIRGLNFKEIQKEEDGKTKIILSDINLEKTLTKKFE